MLKYCFATSLVPLPPLLWLGTSIIRKIGMRINRAPLKKMEADQFNMEMPSAKVKPEQYLRAHTDKGISFGNLFRRNCVLQHQICHRWRSWQNVWATSLFLTVFFCVFISFRGNKENPSHLRGCLVIHSNIHSEDERYWGLLSASLCEGKCCFPIWNCRDRVI